MRIGYAKIGRSWNLDRAEATSVGGDTDVLNALDRLARRFPEHEWVLVGKNSGHVPQEMGFPENVTNPWTEWRKEWRIPEDKLAADIVIEQFRRIAGNHHETLDAMVVWAGQHGSANSRIPMIGADWEVAPSIGEVTGGSGTLATPQYCFIHYCSWLLDYISRWREYKGPLNNEEVWLCPDPRNYMKCRELRWPIRYPVLSQFNFEKYRKAERFGQFPEELSELDPTGYREHSLWVSNVAYVQSGLELTAVGAPGEIPFTGEMGPYKFGMVVNENLTGVKDARLPLVQQWVLPNFPDAEIRGHWTEKSQLKLGRVIQPVPVAEAYSVMRSFATTFTTPASGSEWATAKPWEAFALGSVCFFHPRYDTQGWILPTKTQDAGGWRHNGSECAIFLGQFLRVESPEQLAQRVEEVTSDPELFKKVVTFQREHYENAFARFQGGTRAIADRINQELGGEYESQPWTTRTEPARPSVNRTAGPPRPRGTNEERRAKAPTSRRKPVRGKVLEELGVVAAADGTLTAAEPVTITATQPLGSPVMATLNERVPGAVSDCASKFGFTGSFTGFAYGGVAVGTLGTFSAAAPAILPRPTRISLDEMYLQVAECYAKRSTCARRSVGCVLVNVKGEQLAAGYNGVARGEPHCNEGHSCPGASAASGTSLDACYSAHAEVNALLRCREVDEIHTVYLTVSPCSECVKALMNTGAKRIVFREEYVHQVSRDRWLRSGREWVHKPQ